MGSRNQRYRLRIAALVCAVLVLFGLWFSSALQPPSEGVLPALGPPGAEAVDAELDRPSEGGTGSRSLAGVTVEDRAATPEPSTRPTAQRGTATLTVHVHLANGAPSQGIEVLLESASVNAPPSFDAADTRGLKLRMPCGPRGSAVFEGLPFGSYRASAGDGGGAVDALNLVFTRDAEHSLRLATPAPDDGLVVLVQDVQGAAIPFAEVQIAGGIRETKLVGMQGEPSLRSTCDGQGRAAFPGVEIRAAVVHAKAADGRLGWAVLSGASVRRSAPRKSRAVTVTVDSPGALTGQLLGRPSGWTGESQVAAWALTRSRPYNASFGQKFECKVDGDHYSIEGLGAGRYFLSFEDSKGLRAQYPTSGNLPNSLAPIEVKVEAGMTTVQDLTVKPGAILSGIVRTPAGAPISGALIKTTYTPMTMNFPDGFVLHGANVWRLDSDSRSLGKHPLTHRNTRTDAQGRYRIASLPEGKLRIEVIVPDMTYDRREAVELLDGEVLELEHVLEQAGAMEGLEPEGGYLGARRKGQAVPTHLAVLPAAGDFFFPGLAPGIYEVLRYHSRESIQPVLLAEVAVKAGETTWVDLREAPRPNKYEVRLSSSFGPVVGAYVLASGRAWQETDEQGRAAFESTFPLSDPIRAKVMRGPVQYRVSLAGLVQDRGVWRGELLLGDESLQLRTISAGGSASAAKLTITSTKLEGGAIESASTSALDVGPEGILDLQYLVPGRYKVSAAFPSGAEVSASVEVPGAGPVLLEEYPAGDLSVSVTDSSNAAVAGARIYVTWWAGKGEAPEELPAGDEGRGARSVEADAEGKAVVRGLPAGQISVRIGAPRASWARQGPTVTRQVEVSAGGEAFLAVTVER